MHTLISPTINCRHKLMASQICWFASRLFRFEFHIYYVADLSSATRTSRVDWCRKAADYYRLNFHMMNLSSATSLPSCMRDCHCCWPKEFSHTESINRDKKRRGERKSKKKLFFLQPTGFPVIRLGGCLHNNFTTSRLSSARYTIHFHITENNLPFIMLSCK